MKSLKLACKIKKENDHLALVLPDDTARARAQEIMKYCMENRGGYVSFQLSPPRRPRSTGKGSQSAHFNGHCQQIAEATGQPFADVKKYLKMEALSMGYPMLKNDKGDFPGSMCNGSVCGSAVIRAKAIRQ